jgi:hypothetical protein
MRIRNREITHDDEEDSNLIVYDDDNREEAFIDLHMEGLLFNIPKFIILNNNTLSILNYSYFYYCYNIMHFF